MEDGVEVNVLDSVELALSDHDEHEEAEEQEFDADYYRDQVARPSMQHDAFMRQSGFYERAIPINEDHKNSDDEEEVKHDPVQQL